ncbi:hypothetical protein METBIDRAFT_153691 [Metschnikowia bicuspidata var. bicuspidata NRRL YB-4993]|uniref:Uncharacterized protein n=1 Tax=Metschnikowia bicuspidata var. bicuspidata NRRL YB-4993 TaxID=869754 RepID=A0A1A0HEX2_9ASCO|nr:hypothetical protein METBIDRAFT_153691 [Metschnikowia bicuspidata var. bicuspidata NRRL YB-4993]OBA22458.1 hypothetical protein METBIDRAFT_153691 [Metschnikowia bicuspidata var. bicuspidata NRRL YB-4993]
MQLRWAIMALAAGSVTAHGSHPSESSSILSTTSTFLTHDNPEDHSEDHPEDYYNTWYYVSILGTSFFPGQHDQHDQHDQHHHESDGNHHSEYHSLWKSPGSPINPSSTSDIPQIQNSRSRNFRGLSTMSSTSQRDMETTGCVSASHTLAKSDSVFATTAFSSSTDSRNGGDFNWAKLNVKAYRAVFIVGLSILI